MGSPGMASAIVNHELDTLVGECGISHVAVGLAKHAGDAAYGAYVLGNLATQALFLFPIISIA